MKLDNLREEFPEMPDSIRESIENEVKAQMRVRKKPHLGKILLPFAACMVLLCCAAAASGFPVVKNWLDSLGANKEAAEALVEKEPDISYEEKKPLLLLESYYLDGTKLVFTAKASEAAKGTPLESKDHAEINGLDCLVEHFEEISPEEELYEGCIRVPEGLEGDEFTVSMNLYFKDGIRNFTFHFTSDKLSATERQEEKVISIEGGTVAVRDLTLAPSSVSMKLEYAFSGENAAELCKLYGRGFYKIEDGSGERMDTLRGFNFFSPGVSEENGIYRVSVELETREIDISAKEITVIPYTPECDSEGKVIPDSATVHEELAYTIPLQ